MVEKMSGDLGQNSRASKALADRRQAIDNYSKSETAKEKNVRHANQFKIQFTKGTVFLSAVSAGEIEETTELLDEGVDIDYTNVDGLTALHQACIDVNEDMVNLLLERGANIEARDNEGWTSLHAAASAGSVEIAQILVDNGADLLAVNNEGEVPLDLAEEPEMEEYISEELENQGLDVEEARSEEEQVMMKHAKTWLSKKKIDEELDWQGATALHVAAAKGYTEVVNTLLKVPGVDVNTCDCDGWTALHAAIHWGNKAACESLTEAGADFDIRNSNGQTPCELSEPEFLRTAENLRKKSKDSNLAKKQSQKTNTRVGITIDMNDNSISIDKEMYAIDLLKKQAPRSSFKGARSSQQANNNEKQNSLSESKKKISVDSTSLKAGRTSAQSRPSSITSSRKEEAKDIKPEKQEPAKTESSTHKYSSYRKEREESLSNRPSSWQSDKSETDTTSRRVPSWRSEKRTENSTDWRSSRGDNSTDAKSDISSRTHPKTNATVISINSRGADSFDRKDWRTKLAERVKDVNTDENNKTETRPNHVENSTSEDSDRLSVVSQEESGDELSASRRGMRRNIRENRRSTGVAYMPAEDDDEPDPIGRKTDDSSARKPTSIAERLRLKNQELLSSTNDRSNERTYTSRDEGRDSTTRDRVSERTNRTSYSSLSNDTGDTKDLQRKLDQTNKELQEYKQKYDKVKKERDDLEKKLEQYKEDVEKMKELKNDNLRLKDENGALIRVISKLSRTPATS